MAFSVHVAHGGIAQTVLLLDANVAVATISSVTLASVIGGIPGREEKQSVFLFSH